MTYSRTGVYLCDADDCTTTAKAFGIPFFRKPPTGWRTIKVRSFDVVHGRHTATSHLCGSCWEEGKRP